MIVEKLSEATREASEQALLEWLKDLSSDGAGITHEQFRRLSNRLLPRIEAAIDSVNLSRAFADMGMEVCLIESLRLLGMAVDANIPHHLGHSARVARCARLLGLHMNLPEQTVTEIEQASSFHDVGMVALGAGICAQPRRFEGHEKAILQRHPQILVSMLRPTGICLNLVPILLHHHENWDGTGYPNHLRGPAIPLGARILRLVDVFDALISPRAHRPAHSPAEAQAFVDEHTGQYFDPEVVGAFTGCYRALEELLSDRAPQQQNPLQRI